MRKSNNKKIIIGAIAITLILIILTIVIIRNVVRKDKLNSEKYLATTNTNSNLVAQYIKSGITIGGITGTLETIDTYDADATPSDILTGKTAYAKGEKLTGTFEPLDTSDANATAGDIKQGKTAYVNGQKITGTSTANNYKFATFTASVDPYGNEYVNGNKTVTLPHTVAYVYVGQVANGNGGKTYINITGYSGNTISYYWATNTQNLSVTVTYAYIE